MDKLALGQKVFEKIASAMLYHRGALADFDTDQEIAEDFVVEFLYEVEQAFFGGKDANLWDLVWDPSSNLQEAFDLLVTHWDGQTLDPEDGNWVDPELR